MQNMIKDIENKISFIKIKLIISRKDSSGDNELIICRNYDKINNI